jgi:hypothetical protein
VPRPRSPLAAGLIALAVTACGGHTATKKDVIARGNGICTQTLREARVAASGGTALSSYLPRLVPLVEKEVQQLRKLPRPAKDRAVLNRYLAAVAAEGDLYRQLAAAAQRNDTASVRRVLAHLGSNPGTSLARSYGLTACATAATTAVPR